jgi:hypothetical protein
MNRNHSMKTHEGAEVQFCLGTRSELIETFHTSTALLSTQLLGAWVVTGAELDAVAERERPSPIYVKIEYCGSNVLTES